MDIKKLFIYKLYSHSRPAFIFVAAFLLLYAFFFFKKMDMTFFAYNSMFVSKLPARQTSAYALKVNDRIVPISGKLWWRKDFLESSLNGFSAFLQNERSTYLRQFLTTRIKNPVSKQFFLSRLTPQDADAADFISHYAAVAGIRLQPADKIEIVEYTLQFSSNAVERTDSGTIYIKRSR